MTHTDWDLQRERLSAYLDGELSSTERAELDAHLSGCDECQRELAALRQMRGLLRALPAPALPRSFALPEEPAATTRRKGGAPRWARPAQALGGMAAAVGLGLLVASALPHPSTQYSAAATYNSDRTASGPASAGSGAPATTTVGAGMAPSGASASPAATNTPDYGPEHTPAFRPQAPATQPFPVLPVTGGTLLVGGAAALTLGSLARRRGGAGLPEAESAD